MEQIQVLLNSRIDVVRLFIKLASQYIELIVDVIRGLNPDEYTGIQEAFAAMDKILSSLVISANSNLIASMNQLYINISDLDMYINRILSTVANQHYANRATHNKSTTAAVNVLHIKNSVLNAYEKYSDISLKDDDAIMSIVLGLISPDDAFVFIIANENTINKFTTKLIQWTSPKIAGERRRRLEMLIEKQKDLLLASTRLRLTGPGIHGLICRYNLRPMSSSMSPETLLNSLGANYNSEKSFHDNLRKFAGQNGVILFNKSTKSPVEFNSAGLLTPSDPPINPLAGLNKRIIEKYNTANMLPYGGQSQPAEIILPGNITQPATWYIFETINGTDWRMLAEKIPADRITGILHGLTTRPQQYHAIQSAEILTKYIDARSKSLLSEYEIVINNMPSTEPLKIAISDRIMAGFEQRATADVPKSPEEFANAMINNDDIEKILLDVLTHSTGVKGKGAAEYLVTYVAKFDSIIRTFTKEFERQWNIHPLTARFFEENKNISVGSLAEIGRAIVKSTIDELDRSKLWSDYDQTLKEFFMEQKQIIVE